MGLRFSDVLRLSWTNFASHKKRTFIVAITISLLFGLVLGFNFLLSGLKTTLLETAAQPYGGKVYLRVGYQCVNLFGEKNRDVVEIDNENEIYEPLKIILEEKYGGKILGEMVSYRGIGADIPLDVIDTGVAAVFGEFDLAEMPTGRIPVLSPAERDDSRHTKTYDDFFTIVTYPVTEPGNPTLPGFNPLNLLLWKIYGNSGGAFDYLVKSGTTNEFVRNLAELSIETGGYNGAEQFFEVWAPEKYYVVEFANYEDATNFYLNSDDAVEEYARNRSDGAEYAILKMDMFGRMINIYIDINNLQSMLIMIEILFIVVAIIVATLTFKHLIDQDAANIALYYAMGASRMNICLIYFYYLLELCLLAMILSLLIGSALSLAVALTSAEALAERLAGFYHLAELPQVMLFGLDGFSAIILVVIIFIAPIAMLLSLKRFSAKYVARKLKED